MSIPVSPLRRSDAARISLPVRADRAPLWFALALWCGFFGIQLLLATSAARAQSATLTTLWRFSGDNTSDASGPEGKLLEAGGYFYGTTHKGGVNLGTVYKISPAGGPLNTLCYFNDGPAGGNPHKGLVLGNDGNFYGTAPSGGTDVPGAAGGYGAVFQVTPAGQLNQVHCFDISDGVNPDCNLILGPGGYFYGTAFKGGLTTNNTTNGTIFTVTPSGGFDVLHRFNGGTDGRLPLNGLLLASDGNFYGTTKRGGDPEAVPSPSIDPDSDGFGTIYRITPSRVFTTLHRFTGDGDGGVSYYVVLVEDNGYLYGTTQLGGTYGKGVIYRIRLSDGEFTTLYSFTGGSDGYGPKSGLTLGRDGYLYGTTADDDPNGSGYGTIFRIAPNGQQFTTLWSFDGSEGRVPFTALTQGSDGNFYGTTFYGGAGLIAGVKKSGNGTIFRLSVDAQKPLLTSAPGATVQTGRPFSYQIRATNNPTSYSATGLPAGLGLNPMTGLISGTPTAVSASAVMLSAANAAGTGTLPLTLIVHPAPDKAPAILNVTNVVAAGRVGDIFGYQLSATNYPTSFAASALPAGLSLNPATGLINGSPTTAGTYLVHLIATNSVGNSADTVLTLDIATEAPANPQIYGNFSVTVEANQPFSYPIAATNNPTSYDAAGLPPGLSIDPATGRISGTPTAPGVSSVQLSATNALGTGRQTLTLTVGAPPQPVPAITSAAIATAQIGQTFTYQIAATNAPTSYDASGLPGGLSLDRNTGLISGKPAAAGSSPVTLSATNAVGTGTTLTLNLTVSPSPAPGEVVPNFTPATGTDAVVRAIDYQPDGRAIIGGAFTTYRGVPRSGVARVEANGNLDPSFNPGRGADGTVNTVLVLANGQVLVGGDFATFDGVSRVGVALLKADGSLDTSFDAGLAAPSNPGFAPSAADYYKPMRRTGRLTSDGGGSATASVQGLVTSLSKGPGGAIVLGGAFASKANAGNLQAITRVLAANGQPDPNFAPAGPNGQVRVTLTQPDGRTIIGGDFTAVGGTPRNRLARLNADGALDPSFDPNVAGTVNALALDDDDGSIVVGGDFTQVGGVARNRIARLNADGGVSAGFDPGSGAQDGAVTTVAIQRNTKKVLVGGAFLNFAGKAQVGLARLNPNGALDTSFSTASAVGANGRVNAIVTRADNTALVGGDFSEVSATPSTRLALVSSDDVLPVITSAAGASGQVGVAFSYQITASRAPTSFNATGLPAGLSINTATGLISGTPTQPGTFSIGLAATNTQGTGTAILTLVVTTTPPPLVPVITSAASDIAGVGQPYRYTITATNSPTSFAASGLPDGLSLDAATGLISGTPTRTGTFSVSLSATNSVGTGPSATLMLTVNSVTHPPFFNGEENLVGSIYYLAFETTGTPFGYYAYLQDPHFIYHFDLGYEYWFDAQNAQNGIFFYDFASNSFFYTAPSFPFPYLYDFSLNAILYYFPDPNNPQRYNTNGVRYFYNFATGQIIVK